MKKKNNVFIIIGLVLGIISGLLVPNFIKKISFLGTIYINLLKLMIVPVLFTTITVTIYKTQKERSNLLFKTIITFLIMFIFTFLLTSLLMIIINPAKGFTFPDIKWKEQVVALNYSDIMVNLFPSNILYAFLNNLIFPTILLALIFGISASKVKDGNKAIEVIESFKNIFNKMLEYIMYLTPIGVFSLIGSTIANYGLDIIKLGGIYISMAYLASVLTLILIMIVPVLIITKMSPISYLKKIAKVWLISLTTCSSVATLPYTLKVCNDDLKIPSKITNIVVPLGCTIHMCGGAVSFAILGLFCSSLLGIEINIMTYLLMLVASVLINMAAPGIPSGGVIIGATYLSMFNIPLSFIGFYSGIYKFLDMAYTTLNVTGDISANMIINYWNKRSYK